MYSHIHARASSYINCRPRNSVKVQEKTSICPVSHERSLVYCILLLTSQQKCCADARAFQESARCCPSERLLFNWGCGFAREFHLGWKSTSSLLNLSISERFRLESEREMERARAGIPGHSRPTDIYFTPKKFSFLIFYFHLTGIHRLS